jgi:hypothetical protein
MRACHGEERGVCHGEEERSDDEAISKPVWQMGGGMASTTLRSWQALGSP